MLVAVAATVGGAAIAYLGYTETAGPSGAVRGYFAALARSDAAGALAFGDVPDGRRTLLTTTVLREQQRIAPLRDFSIVSTHRDGAKATVDVEYTLRFPGREVPVAATVALHASSGDWRLDQTAISTELQAEGGRQRQSVLGGPIPTGPVLLFPGALPIRVDTPYLQLDPSRDSVSFGAPTTTSVYLDVTDRARSAMLAAVRAALNTCLTGARQYACPLPDGRSVPGSVHGRVTGAMRTTRVYLDLQNPVGRIGFEASATITGRYRRLNFHNRPVSGPGHFSLDVSAAAYAVAPLTTTWTTS
ncbi:MAG TPA: hypothetical protein VHS54_02840 [Jatrophihabitans sp.]|nr:hypothetical protein [Jatrophihabitans sp.]